MLRRTLQWLARLVLPLAERLLREEGEHLQGFTEAARALRLRYDWPGNVRELQNAVQHGAALATGSLVDDDDLPDALHPLRARDSLRPATLSPSLRPLAEVEREHILGVLKACASSHSEAARVLGIGRNTLWRKRQRDEAGERSQPADQRLACSVRALV